MASNERRKVAGAAADFFLLLQYYYTVRRSGKRNASCPTKGVFREFYITVYWMSEPKYESFY